MSTSQACYRKLPHYKYQLVEECRVQTEIELEKDIETDFIALTVAGELTVKKKYAWDGPSGPTIDTKTFMRGSLVHDALYQLMRENFMDYRQYRPYADKLLKEVCLKDGMNRIRAWYVYQGVRVFGEKSARPGPKKEDKIICAP
ncbi:MAG: hypothetical protein V1794_06955 [Candidatus Glassbacteria bacterium]